MVDEVRTTYNGVPVNADVVVVAGGGSAASQANPGSNASQATAVQGVDGGKPIVTLVSHTSYTLTNAAASNGAQQVLPDTYALALPTAFNGATVTLTQTVNGTTTTIGTYTAPPASPPIFTVYGTTTIQAAVTGGTPTGTTELRGGPSASAASPQAVYSASGAYVDRTVTSLSAGQAAGTASVIGVNPLRRLFAITPPSDGRLYIAAAPGGFWLPLYAGVTRILSGQDVPTNALFVTGQAAGAALPMAEV